MDPLITRQSISKTRSSRFIVLSSLAIIATIGACFVFTAQISQAQPNLLTFHPELRELFTQWKLAHGKTYSTPEEDEYRYQVFLQNYHFINNHNAQGNTAKVGLNQFADLTTSEFKAQYTKTNAPSQPINTQPVTSPTAPLPTTWDWRTKGVVAAVMNQGQCGSAGLFSPFSAITSSYAIRHNNTITEFSLQQIENCATSGGCNGGALPSEIYEYVVKSGLELASDYPATATTCKYNESLAIQAITAYTNVPAKSSAALQAAAYLTPLSVNVDASDQVFQMYTSGVITTGCNAEIDHVLTVVGWDVVNGVSAWICQNSWGSDWGMEGYVYISMDGTANNGEGVCGILSGPVAPV